MKSLNARVSWIEALPAIGCRLKRHALPTTANCPICEHGRIQFFNDNVQSGIYCYCKRCHHASDLFELLRVKLQLNEGNLVNWLLKRNLLTENMPLKRLLAQRANFNKRFKALDKLFKPIYDGDTSFVSGAPNRLMRQLGLKVPSNVSASWIRSGPGKLFVYADRMSVENALRPPRDEESRYADSRKMVVSPDADYMLAVPFYDCPGRVCSVSLLYTDPTRAWTTDNWFLKMGRSQPINGGIAIHLESLKRTDHDEIILTDDLDTYLSLQCKHFLTHFNQALPLACYRSKPSERTQHWQVLHRKSPIIWSDWLRPRQLWQAIRLDAKVSRYGPTTVTLREFIDRHKPYEVLGNVRKRAVPWPKAVATLASEKDLDELEDWYAQLELSPEEHERVLSAASTSELKVLKLVNKSNVTFRSVPFRSGFAEQRPSGWFYVKRDGTEQLITSAPFKIKELIADGAGDSVATVEVSYGDKRHTFQCAKRVLESDPLNVVEQELIEEAIALPACDKSFSKNVFSLAVTFYPPNLKRRQSKVGLSKCRERLELPHFSINLQTGRIRNNKSPNLSLPASTIDSPNWSAGLLSDLLSDSHSSPVLSVTLGMLCQLSSTLFGNGRLRLGLLNTSTIGTFSQLFAAVGGQHCTGKRVATISSEVSSNDWFSAVGIDDAMTNGVMQSILSQPSDGLLSLPVTPGQACHGLITGNMIVMQYGVSTQFPKHQLSNLGNLMCGWLCWVAKNNKTQILSDSNDLLHDVTKILSEYLESHNVDSSPLTAAKRELISYGGKANRLAEAVHFIKHHSDKSDRPNGLLKLDQTIAAISRKKFNQWLRSQFAPEISHLEFNSILCGQHTKNEIRNFDGDQFWVTPRGEYKKVAIRRTLISTLAKKKLQVA